MISNDELQEWKRDIGEAQNTHPNAFANGPFVKSLFRTAQQISIVEQRLVTLASTMRESNDLLKRFIAASESLSTKLFWLNLALVAATIVGAIATAKLAFNF